MSELSPAALRALEQAIARPLGLDGIALRAVRELVVDSLAARGTAERLLSAARPGETREQYAGRLAAGALINSYLEDAIA